MRGDEMLKRVDKLLGPSVIVTSDCQIVSIKMKPWNLLRWRHPNNWDAGFGFAARNMKVSSLGILESLTLRTSRFEEKK